MAYSSYSGNNSPANSKVTIDSDEDQGLPIDNFDKEETQFDTQGDIVSISSTIITDTPRERNSSGEIKFRREIYSPAAFKQQVDTSFSELNNTSEIDVSTFFRQYSRLFYDIPRQGGYMVWVSMEKKFNSPSSLAVNSWEPERLIKKPLLVIPEG